MAKINQLKAGIILNYTLSVLYVLMGLLYTPYMLRKLGQSEYGLYALVASVMAHLSLLDLGFGDAIVRYTAKYRAEGKLEEQYNMFGMFFAVYVVISLLVLIAGVFLYFNLPVMFGETMTGEELGRAKIMILLLVVSMVVSFLFNIFGSIITAYEEFVFSKGLAIISLIFNTLSIVFVLSLGYKAVAMVVVSTMLGFICQIFNYCYCKFKLKVKIHFGKFDKALLAEISTYSLWIFLSVLMNKIYWSSGKFVLGAVSGTVAVSILALAINMVTMYISLSGSISGVFLPKVTSMVATDKSPKELSDLFIRVGRLQFSAIAIVFSGFVVFGKYFFNLWAGPEYAESYTITIIFFTAQSIPLIQSIGITILKARNDMKFCSLTFLVSSALCLLCQIIFSKWYGTIGCAIGTSLAIILGHGLVMNIYFYKKQQLAIIRFWSEIGRMAIIPLILSVVGIILISGIAINSWQVLIVLIMVYAIIYIPLFWHFSMSSYERNLIGRPILNLIGKWQSCN